jgi:uncharacterized membrane protein
MRFATWNVRSLYRADSLMTVAKEIAKYDISYIWLEYRRSDGTEVAPNQRANLHFSMERGMRILN